jgi:hypothetical protein
VEQEDGEVRKLLSFMVVTLETTTTFSSGNVLLSYRPAD